MLFNKTSLKFVLLLLLTVGAANSAFAPKLLVRAEKDGSAYLCINGGDAAHFITANAGLQPSDRAKKTLERLSSLVQKGLDPTKIRTKPSGRNSRILMGETLIAIVTTAEAKAHSTTAPLLSEVWAANIRKLLTLPPLSAKPTVLTVPYGETRNVEVLSLLPQSVVVESKDPTIAAVDVMKKPGFIVVTGCGVGDTDIKLQSGEYATMVTVSVRKYAAALVPSERTVVVTGLVCPSSLVARAARDNAVQAIVVEPAGTIQQVSVPQSLTALGSGQRVQVPVIVEASGPGLLPVHLAIPVVVQNQAMNRAPTTWIMYSNNPEALQKFQSLFSGRLEASGQATRLLYHHQNMMDRKIGFVIDVVNPSATPAKLHVMEGVSSPMLDTVIVGYIAGLEFMENQRGFVGRVFDIPAFSRQILVSQGLGHAYTASGIMELFQVSGNPLLLRVTAEPEEQRLSDSVSDIPIPAPGVDMMTTALSDQIYPDPLQKTDVTYTAGKQWVFFRLGKDHLKHATEDLKLYGNYGVTYDIKANIENPTGSSLNAEVAFEATAGPTSGLFYIDGDVVKVKYLTSLAEASLYRVTVPPGKTKTVSIRTIPLSGSAYPATLVIRPIGTTAGMGGK